MVGALWAWSCSFGPTPPPDAPDVLIISVDTLRADRLGFSGHSAARTPALDALAKRGRIFRQATTPLPRTTPALASLHTGLAPHNHASREVGTPIRKGLPTLSQSLRSVGWKTVAVSAMKVAGPAQGLDSGFDAFTVMHDAPADEVVKKAQSYLTGRGPLFLWVHLADPHFPYTPNTTEGACAELVPFGQENGRAAVFMNRDDLARTALDDCQRRYDDEIARVDQALGAMIDAFEQRPGDGVVIFTADHGENQGERGLFYEHGPNVHDASLRVPYVVAGPGVAPGEDLGVLSLTDTLPSLLGLLDLTIPDGLDGEDTSARWRGASPPANGRRFAESGSALHVRLFGALVSGRKRRWCLNDPPYSLCHKGRQAPTLHRHDLDPGLQTDLSEAFPDVRTRLLAAANRWPAESARERTVRTDRFKLVARPKLEGGYTLALLDTRSGESVERPEVQAELAAALDTWDAPRPTSQDRDQDTIEALRALGYVE
ncbi:MAG: sulfatase [Myxococcota bacterium]